MDDWQIDQNRTLIWPFTLNHWITTHLFLIFDMKDELCSVSRCVPVLLVMKEILIQDALLIPVLNPPVESMLSALRTVGINLDLDGERIWNKGRVRSRWGSRNWVEVRLGKGWGLGVGVWLGVWVGLGVGEGLEVRVGVEVGVG